MPKVNDKELKEFFIQCKQNNRIGFEKLYKTYSNLVYRIAFSILKNKEDSEDIVQIVFSKIYQIDKNKLPKDKEASWLYNVTKNEVLTFLRKKKTYVDIDSIYEIKDEDNEINNIIDQDSYNKLISKLNNKEKEVISLKLLTNLSFEEIAKLLNEPTGTVKWRYYKSVHTLKIFLSNLGMFIITFVIGIKTILIRPRNNSENMKIDTEINLNETTKTDMIEGTLNPNEDTSKNMQNIIESETIKEEVVIQDKTKENMYYYEIGILSVSGIFLIFTIIFAVFFIKYQLKGNKKTSK